MKLQFTNGYRPRFDQITRIMQYLLTQQGRKRIPRQDMVSALGVPVNQVENLISMMIGFGLVKPITSVLTSFGEMIIHNDPYFEKLDTLWMIHYVVSSNPEWVVWHRIVNQVIPVVEVIKIENVAASYFADLANHFSQKTITEKLPKEIGAVLSSYTRSNLARLNMLRQEDAGFFMRSEPETISPLAFLYCLVYYRELHAPGSTALNVEEVCCKNDGPGAVLYLAEYKTRGLLGQLHDLGMVRMEQFGNLDQVRIPDQLTQTGILQQIYRN